MSRLIDISKYEVLSFQDKSQDFVDGVQWILEQMDKEPTVKAIPLEKLEQIREHFEAIAHFNGTVKADYVLRMLDKAIKEQSE